MDDPVTQNQLLFTIFGLVILSFALHYRKPEKDVRRTDRHGQNLTTRGKVFVAVAWLLLMAATRTFDRILY